MKRYLRGREAQCQLVPLHAYRRNATERAISTFKNHFTAILCMLHPKFPMSMWCRLLKQSEMTINMVSPCRLNPRMSAYAALEGEFNCSDTPLVPLGSNIIAGDTNSQQASEALHGTKAWCVGPAVEHCRCVEVHAPKTRGTIIADTFKWSDANNFKRPKITHEEQLTIAVHKLAIAIKNNSLCNLPNQELSKKINQIETLFHASVENITKKKLTLLASESSSFNLRKPFDPLDEPMMTDDSNPSLRVADEDSNDSPRVVSTLRTMNKIPNKNVNANSASTYADRILENSPSQHRCPISSKVARAAATIQQHEAVQMKNHDPVTCNFQGFDIFNPPNQLKCKNLLLTEDKELWENGMCNELGMLAQGCKDIKGNNALHFINKSATPKGKKVTHAIIVCAIRL